jgi:predicted small lipoprotein YifL
MTKALHIAIGLIFLATLGLAGCGVKGPLKKPADAPKETAIGPDGKKPHRSFILDGLIR